MRTIAIAMTTLALAALLTLPLTAQAEDTAKALAKGNKKAAMADLPFDPGAGVMARPQGSMTVDGQRVPVAGEGQVHAGTFVPDGRGGYLWLGSDQAIPRPSIHHAAGREIRLKIREMAAQMFESGVDGLAGGVAMPASFVSQDNFERSSAFGRYIAEQMFYELNQMGVAVREYRAMPRIMTRPQDGEFVLTRDMEMAAPIATDGLALTGTYYFDKHNVFVNARLFRPVDGLVLRTANLVFAQTPVTLAMLKKGTGVRLQTAEMEMKSLDKMKDDASLEYMLQQDDFH